MDREVTTLIRGRSKKDSDMIRYENKRYNNTGKKDRSYSKQYQFRSTYVVLNRNSGRITLQQQVNHFHVSFPCSNMDREVTTLIRGRSKKDSDMIRYENKRYNNTGKKDRSYSKQYQFRSTYIVYNRNSGRITLQQDTSHFHDIILSSIVDGKETTLIRERNQKESDMIRYEI